MMKIAVFAIGWLLFVAAQAQNSVRSTSNGLQGWPGYRLWLRAQGVNLATRAFFSGLFYGLIVSWVTAKIQGAGLAATGTTIAGISGYSANAVLYQILGYFPFLRAEVHELAPPDPADQASPTQAQKTGG